MPVKTVEEIKGILESGDFNQLIGSVENDIIEFKGAPYQLNNEYSKQELAKDVSGLANSKGGLILLGVATLINPTHHGEEVTEIKLYEKSIVNIKQYHDVLSSWIYPSLNQIDVRWISSSTDSKKGIIAVEIPKQPHTKKPFLVTRTIEETGKLNTIVFGYFERKRTNVEHISIGELHSIIRNGVQINALTDQYENIQQILSQILSAQSSEGSQSISVRDVSTLRIERVSEALSAAALTSNPVFIISAIPVNNIEVKGLFESRDSEIVRLIEHPPEVRYGGFDIDTSSTPRIVRGLMRRAVSEKRNSLELWKDGTLIFTATGDAEFLSWGRYTPDMNYLRINQIALIESTYLFVKLSEMIFSNHINTPLSEVEYVLELQNMTVNGQSCRLSSGAREAYFSSDLRRAPDTGGLFAIRSSVSNFRPGKIAFELIREVYRWFGFEDDKIPYTMQIEDHKEINPEAIKNIR